MLPSWSDRTVTTQNGNQLQITSIYTQTVQRANQIPGTGRVRKQAGRQTDTDGQVQARDPKPIGRRLSPKQAGFKTGKNSKI